MKNKNTYVLMISKVFLKDHIKAGMPTNFKEKIAEGKKKHTIRGKYSYWKDISDKVNAGIGILSVRQWEGKPYNSTPIEIFQLHHFDIQKCDVNISGSMLAIKVDGISLTHTQERIIMKNDGLVHSDFVEWFKEPVIDGCIIHFTDLRY